MITIFESYESKSNWTLEKIRNIFQLDEYPSVNPQFIIQDPMNEDSVKILYVDIIDYFKWKYKISSCYLTEFFRDEETYLGIRFLGDKFSNWTVKVEEDEPKFVDFLNNKEMYLQTQKYNI